MQKHVRNLFSEEQSEMKISLLALLIVTAVIISVCKGDRGCPRNVDECRASCGNNVAACERRWCRWRLQWRCMCEPCRGRVVMGVCVKGSLCVNLRPSGNGTSSSLERPGELGKEEAAEFGIDLADDGGALPLRN